MALNIRPSLLTVAFAVPSTRVQAAASSPVCAASSLPEVSVNESEEVVTGTVGLSPRRQWASSPGVEAMPPP